jgi:hypothetical protein
MSERIRIVVGEGHGSIRPGLLRFVLESDGFEVLAEAGTATELAQALAAHSPDVVVLDDGIGVTAVQLSRDTSPASKILLVWPDAVMPVGGDARVEPGEILSGLSLAVTRLAALRPASPIETPAWVEKVKKDPRTLREMLVKHGGVVQSRRPSVTELQRRGQRLHPSAPTAAEAATDTREGESVAPLLILPAAPAAAGAAAAAGSGGAEEATIVLPGASAPGGSRIAGARAGKARNRKIGMMALGGAVAVSAVSFALAIGASHIPTSLLRSATAFIPDPIPPGVAVVWSPPPSTPDHTGGNGGPSPGQPSGPTQGPDIPGVNGGGGGGVPGTHSGGGGTGGGGTGGGGTGGGGDGGGGTGGGGTGGGDGGGRDLHGHGVGPLGMSADHNPNGGPPGQTHDAPRYSQGDPTPGTGNGHRPDVAGSGHDQSLPPHRHKR